MNYFEIFNKVMLELNYRQISLFENVFKTEHMRILENINRVNADVCLSCDWSFLQKKKTLVLEAGEILATERVFGQAIKIYDNNTKLVFSPNYEGFFAKKMPKDTYSCFNNKVLFSPSDKKRELTLYYSSYDIALGADGSEKAAMSAQEDTTIIPMPFAEQLLVYGTCMKTKANPAYPKFGFWNTLYTMSLMNLRSKCSPTGEDTPALVLKHV